MDQPADFLRPYFLFSKDPEHPTEEEAARADAEVKVAYKARLKMRVAAMHARRTRDQEELRHKQQAYARIRNPSAAATAEFNAAMEGATYRLGVLDGRIAEAGASLVSQYAALEARLRVDPRLQSVYDAEGYKKRLEALGLI